MKTDRRVQRTRELLQKALIELISERGYDAITIQDIVDHANVGRTTFYLHYNSQDVALKILSSSAGNGSARLSTARHPASCEHHKALLANWPLHKTKRDAEEQRGPFD
jgi:AcrR family transcriptional regulator